VVQPFPTTWKWSSPFLLPGSGPALSYYLEVVQPLWLSVVFSSEDASVQEHQDNDEPEHGLKQSFFHKT
jgi:hypothetical protein